MDELFMREKIIFSINGISIIKLLCLIVLLRLRCSNFDSNVDKRNSDFGVQVLFVYRIVAPWKFVFENTDRGGLK